MERDTEHLHTLGVYIHIPFCLQKCLYCDFLSAPAEEAVRDRYVKALCEEICAEAVHYGRCSVATVFIGGGTPSVLSGQQIQTILSCLRSHYRLAAGAEITMEMNPGTVTEEKLSAYRAAGINRISLGLQSADNEELRRLGRIHTWETFLESFRFCRTAGFANINVDLMSALPGQTLDSYRETVRKIMELQPEHVSAYSLIIEEGTPFYEKYRERAEEANGQGKCKGGSDALPDEETDRAMYEETKRLLGQDGYSRYEISNYAKPGRECRHNCTYWTRGDYVGLGLGASSLVDNVRWQNIGELGEYLNARAGEKKRERYILSAAEQMEETMFLGLRMMRGVSEADFLRTFGYSMEEIYGAVIRRHRQQGLLKKEKGRICLTDAGIEVSNYVMADFLLSNEREKEK